MTTGDDPLPSRTVFRPSPLQDLAQPAAAAAIPPAAAGPPAPMLPGDDVPAPAAATAPRNPLMAHAAPVLALAASVRAGRVQLPLPQLHREAVAAIAAFDRAIVPLCSEEQRLRARYALCATLDDIAQNLPGQAGDGAEWARRSLVVQFFQENIGGERFWQLCDDMLARPSQWPDLIELYHACLAAGFEGKFRVMPDGRRRQQEVMTALYAGLAHVRALSAVELSPHWRGIAAPVRKVGFWSYLALAAAAAVAGLLLVYAVLRLLLMQSGAPVLDTLAAINPQQPLRLSRVAPPPPAPLASAQLQRIRQFLAPEIAQRLVAVDQDTASIRVRTTIGQLFRSGSQTLEPGRRQLFERIAHALAAEPGPVKVEGHADSDRVSLAFPDNFALSRARAETVAGILRAALRDPLRVSAEGFGDSRPIASNATAAGKARNRRVEIVLPRSG